MFWTQQKMLIQDSGNNRRFSSKHGWQLPCLSPPHSLSFQVSYGIIWLKSDNKNILQHLSGRQKKKESAANFTTLKKDKTNKQHPLPWNKISIPSPHFQTITPASRILQDKCGLQQTLPIHTFLKRWFLKLSSAARGWFCSQLCCITVYKDSCTSCSYVSTAVHQTRINILLAKGWGLAIHTQVYGALQYVWLMAISV